MLKPVPIPTSPDKAGWERLRAFFISSEMEPTAERPNGLTPSAAAAAADARLLNVYRGVLPGGARPFEVASTSRSKGGPFAGGQRTKDGRTWLVISRPEDDRSMFPEKERLTADDLRRLAASYDPETVHRAPVVLPSGGPAHWTGEYDRVMPGDVDALEFDGYFLWALIRERDGAISKAVANGLGNRSIRAWDAWPDAGGEPYLRHLAITAEPAGTSNLGLLDEVFVQEQKDRGRTEAEIEPLRKLATRDRNVPDLPQIERTTTMDDPKIPTPEEIQRTVDEAVKAALAAQPKAPDIGAAVTAAVTAAVKPLQDQLAESQRVVKEAAADARKTRIRTALDEHVRSGRLTPPQRKTVEGMLLAGGFNDEQIDAQLGELGKLSPVITRRSTGEIVDQETGDTMRIPEELTAPPESGLRDPDPMGAKVVAKAREAAAKESDPEKARAIFNNAILAAYGEGPASAGRLPFVTH